MLPTTGISWLQLEAFPAAIIALSMYTSTYVAEIVRAAIEALPKGQDEAARSTGMTTFQSMTNVILPQALKLMIPPMGGYMSSSSKELRSSRLLAFQNWSAQASRPPCVTLKN